MVRNANGEGTEADYIEFIVDEVVFKTYRAVISQRRDHARPNRRCILYSFGQLESSMNEGVEFVQELILRLDDADPEVEHHFVIWDYPGYGKYWRQKQDVSKTDTEFNALCRYVQGLDPRCPMTDERFVRAASEAVLKTSLKENPTVPMYLWGRSIGSYATCYLLKYAMENQIEQIKGVILISPLQSVISLRFCDLFLDSRFDILNNHLLVVRPVGRSTLFPVKMIHHERDPIIPITQAVGLQETFQQVGGYDVSLKKLTDQTEDCHNLMSEYYMKAVCEFLLQQKKCNSGSS